VIERRKNSQKRLDSWKSIARYLDRSSRTIQRWHTDYGLPIHRIGGNKGPIFAYSDELDLWLRDRGRVLMNPSSETAGLIEIAKPILLHTPIQHMKPDPRDEAPDAVSVVNTLHSSSDRARSAELVAIAHKKWETLSQKNLPLISQLFREAIDLDYCNAMAFAGLSQALIAGGMLGSIWPPTAYTSAKAALLRALELDPNLPDARCASALLKLTSTRDWKGAYQDFNELRCTNTSGLIGQALLLIAEENLHEAFGLLQEAGQKDALSTLVAEISCWNQYLMGDFSHTLDHIEQIRYSGRTGIVLDVVESLSIVQLYKPKDCILQVETLLSNSPKNELLRGVLGYAYAISDQIRIANRMIDEMMNFDPSHKFRESYATALIFIGLNRKRDAVKCLEQSYREGSLWSLGFRSDPILKSLRTDSDYIQMMNKIGYPGYDNPGQALLRRLSV
jgi:tetratricopeptide (TPR) repeat protein